jgi:hypothetical protein
MTQSVTIPESGALPMLLQALDLPSSVRNEILADPTNADRAYQELTPIAALEANQAAGKMQVRIGTHHLKLKKLIYDATFLSVGIGVGALSAPVGGLIVFGKLIDILQKLPELLKKLTDAELLIYNVIAEIQKNRRAPIAGSDMPSLTPGTPRGTETDIRNALQQRGQMVPRNLPAILQSLHDKGAVQREVTDTDTIYSTTW